MHGKTNAYTLKFLKYSYHLNGISCPHTFVNINTIQNYFVLQSKLFSFSRIQKKLKNETLGKTLIQMT